MGGGEAVNGEAVQDTGGRLYSYRASRARVITPSYQYHTKLSHQLQPQGGKVLHNHHAVKTSGPRASGSKLHVDPSPTFTTIPSLIPLSYRSFLVPHPPVLNLL